MVYAVTRSLTEDSFLSRLIIMSAHSIERSYMPASRKALAMRTSTGEETSDGSLQC